MPDTFSNYLGWLWENSLAATVLCLIASAVTFTIGGKFPPAFRYALWLLVMLRLIWPAAPASEISVMNLREHRSLQVPALATPAARPTAPIPGTPTTDRSAIVFWLWAAGACGTLLIVGCQHWRLSRWAARQPASANARVLKLLATAQRMCRTEAEFHRVVVSSEVAVPAVFRWRKPVLLLPGPLVANATDEELLLVLTHEVVHVKHRDLLINSFCLVVRSLHWFNPAVWFAWRRLCAECEQVCDAAVLAQLNPAQRSVYGNLLINLASEAFRPFPRSIVVPILQHKPEIHRRIVMIAQFKRAPIALASFAALVVLVIACVTFTRAAQNPKPPQAVPPATLPADALAQQLAKQEERVRVWQDEVHKLRMQLDITRREDQSGASALSEAVHKTSLMVLEARSEHRRLKLLHDLLRGLPRKELASALPTALPDAQLANLMDQLHTLQQKLADLIEGYTPEHPEIRRVTRMTSQVEKQIGERMEGILAGLQVKRQVEQARLESLQKELEILKDQAAEHARAKRPYDEALRNLRTAEMLLERLRLRAMEEQLNTK